MLQERARDNSKGAPPCATARQSNHAIRPDRGKISQLQQPRVLKRSWAEDAGLPDPRLPHLA
eukprot:8689003-Pyramimonas_sp.AAC.1